MPIELRCNGNMYGVLSDDHTTIEVKCKRRKCGYAPGIVILHTISLESGEEIHTEKFTEPIVRKA